MCIVACSSEKLRGGHKNADSGRKSCSRALSAKGSMLGGILIN
jgi:hypothetical protein